MDSEMIYALGGIIVFAVIAFFALRTDVPSIINTKEEKREAILSDYREQLREALYPLRDDKEARIAKKSALLKKFNSELSMNIFFDKIEIREVILDLAEGC